MFGEAYDRLRFMRSGLGRITSWQQANGGKSHTMQPKQMEADPLRSPDVRPYRSRTLRRCGRADNGNLASGY